MAFDALVAVYWLPVYKYVRLRWLADRADAEDLTQEFFARAFEKGPSAASIRGVHGSAPFCACASTGSWRTSERRPADDALFRQEWVRSLFTDAVTTLRESCLAAGKATHFAVFERYDLEDHLEGRPTYAQLATELDIPVTQVTNYLAFARRELRRDVALKVVRLPEASPDVVERMLREARTLARLEHPGIVPVHDVGELPDGRAFYVMKLVRGSPLDALPPGPLAGRLEIVEHSRCA